MKAGPLLLVGAGLLLLTTQRARASTPTQGDWTINIPPGEEVLPGGVVFDETQNIPEDFPLYDFDPNISFFDLPIPMPISYQPSPPELDAILYMIRNTEVGKVPDSERYYYGYGYKRFNNISDHPVATGELTGARLPDAMCRAAGRAPGCVSTAAGAYQIILPTWKTLREQSPRLPDFSPASQDEAARRLLRRIGVESLLRQGDLEGAIRKAGTQWASLPGSTAQQGPVAMSRAMSLFREGLAQTGGGSVVV